LLHALLVPRFNIPPHFSSNFQRGRIKQKGTKKADLVDIGHMVFEKGWCNPGEGGGE
jgi:hypothetical protein